MNKYDNYVYMTICEVSLNLFKNSKCSTYFSYCRLLGMSLRDGNLSKRERADIIEISNKLDAIYTMKIDVTGRYISDFFELEKYLVFEKSVRMIKEFFPITGNC